MSWRLRCPCIQCYQSRTCKNDSKMKATCPSQNNWVELISEQFSRRRRANNAVYRSIKGDRPGVCFGGVIVAECHMTDWGKVGVTETEGKPGDRVSPCRPTCPCLPCYIHILPCSPMPHFHLPCLALSCPALPCSAIPFQVFPANCTYLINASLMLGQRLQCWPNIKTAL